MLTLLQNHNMASNTNMDWKGEILTMLKRRNNGQTYPYIGLIQARKNEKLNVETFFKMCYSCHELRLILLMTLVDLFLTLSVSECDSVIRQILSVFIAQQPSLAYANAATRYLLVSVCGGFFWSC